MRLFLDANVLLDVLLARQPFVNDSERVLSLCAKKVFDGCCSGLTICNLMYILRKHCPMDVARRCDKKGFIDSSILVYTPTELLERHAGA